MVDQMFSYVGYYQVVVCYLTNTKFDFCIFSLIKGRSVGVPKHPVNVCFSVFVV